MARVKATTAGSPSGMAATASETALTNCSWRSYPRTSPSTKTTMMTMPAMRARVRPRRSVWRCSGVGSGSASCSMWAIRPVSVAIPVAVTRASARPRVTMVFMKTAVIRSPSGARSSTSAAADLPAGCASPVSEDSCTSSEVEENRRPSAGIRSPASTMTTSPGTSSAASTRTVRPSRRTVAVVTSICFSASSEFSARDSWTKPVVALSSTTRTITTGVSHSRVTARLTAAATSRIKINRFWNWRRKTRHRGSRGVSASRFGPYRPSRRAASADDSPTPGSTPSPRAVVSGGTSMPGSRHSSRRVRP